MQNPIDIFVVRRLGVVVLETPLLETPLLEEAKAEAQSIYKRDKVQVTLAGHKDNARPTTEEFLVNKGMVMATELKRVKRGLDRHKHVRQYPLAEGLAKRQGLDTSNPEFSSPELTAEYVRQFCSMNNLKK